MLVKHPGRRARALLFGFILLLGLLPAGMVTADTHRTSSRVEIEFVTTPIEVLEPGEEWVDEAGHAHFRGMVERDEISGDLTGEAIITINGDFIPGPSCAPNDPDNCFEGEFSGWGSIVITDENGSWEGEYLQIENFLEGEEPFTFGKVMLAGRGGNAGKSIVADLSNSGGETDAVVLTGTLLTLGVPASGINMHTQLCLDMQTFGLSGGFVSTGAVESSGGATSTIFIEGGTQWTHRYGLFVELVFTDEQGSMTIQLLGQAQDTAETHVGWGHFMIVGGTGSYADLYGHGKVTGYGGEHQQCESAYGVSFQLLGDAHRS